MAAAENPADFVQALREGGYADIAAEYLVELKQSKELPPELGDVWDLGNGQVSPRRGQAYNAGERDWDMAKAQKHLNRFLKDKPDHPDALLAMVWWAGFSAEQALDHLRAAKDTRLSKEKQAEQRRLPARPCAMPSQNSPARPRNSRPSWPRPAARNGKTWQGAGQLGGQMAGRPFPGRLVRYYLAQACDDPEDLSRTELLEKTAAAFDADLPGQSRDRDGPAGTPGRAGWSWSWATPIWPRISSTKCWWRPPNPRKKPGLPPSWNRSSRRCSSLPSRSSPRNGRAVHQRSQDLDTTCRKLKHTDGYQGISLDFAKALLEMSEKAKGPDKGKLFDEAMKVLAEMVPIRSSAQQEAIRLRQEHRPSGGEALTLDEAMVAGDAAAGAAAWNDAVEHYEKALELAEKFPNRRMPSSGSRRRGTLRPGPAI